MVAFKTKKLLLWNAEKKFADNLCPPPPAIDVKWLLPWGHSMLNTVGMWLEGFS